MQSTGCCVVGGESYPSAKMQSAYTSALIDWTEQVIIIIFKKIKASSKYSLNK